MKYETIPRKEVWLRDSSLQPSIQNLTNRQFSLPRVDLTPIDDLITLYEKAWSPMAKRNLVVDLSRAIGTWERAHPGALPVAMAALKDLVGRLQHAIPSFQKYAYVICTGWNVGCQYTAGNGHSTADKSDMEKKCNDMVKAAIAAKVAISVRGLGDNDQTLKIFMAPEFYFRGENGAYSPEIVSQIMPRLRMSLRAGWENWLFVFGTAVASFEDDIPYCTRCGAGNSKITFETISGGLPKPKCDKDTGNPPHLTAVGAEVHNVALVCYAGEEHLIAKEYVSPIDYKGDSVRVPGGLLKALPPAGSKASRIQSLFNDERMGGCILNFAGVTVGIEVCLDHVKSTRAPSNGVGRGAAYSGSIQILLIPSFGMEIKDKLHCRSGGVVFNVDGRGQGKTDVARNGLPTPQRFNTGVLNGRGSVDVWERVSIPL